VIHVGQGPSHSFLYLVEDEARLDYKGGLSVSATSGTTNTTAEETTYKGSRYKNVIFPIRLTEFDPDIGPDYQRSDGSGQTKGRHYP
jgi:hypothetical protein